MTCKCGGSRVNGYKIIMLRHGESEWTNKNLFCGWVDVDLSDRGKKEAITAAESLKKENYVFDLAFTSALKRSQITCDKILDTLGQSNIPRVSSWRLNERHYGALTGLNKAETVDKYGEEQVQIWRRSFDILPPPMNCDHPYFNEIMDDPKYKDDPTKENIPRVESLKSTMERALPFWDSHITPKIREGKNIFIAAHGTSLRGIIKFLDNKSNEEIMKLNLPTGIPFEYTLDKNMKPVPGGSLRFLEDPEIVKKAMEEVANQGKKKKID